MQNSNAVANRPSTVRSRITNGSSLLRNVDGRRADARRFRDLVESLGAELGGPEKLGESEKALIRQAASLIIRCEGLQADLVNGAPVDDEQLVRLANVAGRLLTRLGLKRKAREIVPGGRLRAMVERDRAAKAAVAA